MVLSYIKKFFLNYITQAFGFISIAIVIIISLLTYNSSDPSFNLVTDKVSANFLKDLGSYLADMLFQSFGLCAFIIPICLISWAFITYRNGKISLFLLKIALMLLSIVALSIPLSSLTLDMLPASCGGFMGLLIRPFFQILGQDLDLILDLVCIVSGMILFILCLGIDLSSYYLLLMKINKIIGRNNSVSNNHDKISNKVTIKRMPPISADLVQNQKDDSTNLTPQKGTSYQQLTIPKLNTKNPSVLPPIDLLNNKSTTNVHSESVAELKSNAENLLNVLNDFGVKGRIIDVSLGPVVTLYEFEPSAGTKSSRIIGLSDDIARSLSALSTRIAVIPGRNVLGIELPNKQRAFFCLKELIETQEYNDPNITLPLILGKDLSGKAYVADLAKMPHLLVAGTTGSGKSVAINTMIMSLLYRYTPEDCRLIMIDPKMLELSSYEGIPHLLTPVVTEAPKAIVALKWAVKEMENRYRLMSNIGVRNVASYNSKIAESLAAGKTLERTVQTGFDPETGKPIYESMPLDLVKLPFIVVIVDEMADLMLVGGKDIESSIQRLAQMARAAGIHIIMATQRPSVDVITGVIKANFPSRISFKVTSKIDSRTILGEQGAEQLLGMGDMLYMGNHSKITRVHGPFIDDHEVMQVTEYLKSTGTPDYVYAVTEAQENEQIPEDYSSSDDNDNNIYNKAIQIVKLERKVSISYIQRCLRIGYNRAADIVEKMEKDGIVSSPNHTGKREILLPED